MTNEQIIADIAVTIWGEKAVEEMILKGEIPLHTAKVWNDRGYMIRKNEHGLRTRLWKKRKRKNISIAEEDEQPGQIPNSSDFYLAKAYLFRGDQVEKAKVKLPGP